ncbi:MAG: SagB/ThcOx family dehydrogenase, partial [Firmicutes bacterium]|nr:SagB/ThcOx family dehydrogenase [Bacillota bacterium]
MDERVKELRASMKSGFTGEPIESDQNKGVPAPQMMLFAKDDNYVKLPSPEAAKTSGKTMLELVRARRSRRKYTDEPLTKEQLSYLLFCTQGYEELRPGQLTYAALRTVPSAGCRHPFDTYLAVRNVTGIEPGFYRYLPRENGLE